MLERLADEYAPPNFSAAAVATGHARWAGLID